MATTGERLKQWWDRTRKRLQNTYRFIIMNNDTFEEVGSYRLTLMNVYVAASTIVVLVAILVVLAIAFTPIRRYVPGYGQGGDGRREVERLYREVDGLREQLNAQREYSESIKRVLIGDYETAEEVESQQLEVGADTLAEVERSPEEEQLRQELELQEVGQAARQGKNVSFSPGDVPLEQMFFSPPVTGEISAIFMPDKKHYGVDVLAPKNTAIKAAMDGFIFFADWTLETGNTIGIQHANNTITFYKHNSSLLKKSGSYVKAGEAVAIIGNTGTLTDGPHLHFELWHKGKPVDPTEYIKF
ncbi:M23 family metallopeptidase [Phaeodactylibacter luteus]|uniref:Peptidoglycan DD-metalloendopeptidase family protein n=1 Tax=Phaeodactylibacter luteus TaxID=1564516 RepID=A0A5C6RI78_9BACT|nr:M23 family metallopeptidase [Phaeodactylibacter luteus]TXB61615.1 peptidoglycan DD-metalloendopeptidase family protein [Phaeodactylibacter luteus]